MGVPGAAHSPRQVEAARQRGRGRKGDRDALLIQTIFDGDTTTFDRIAGTSIQISKGPGLLFLGQALTIDRYLAEDTADNATWIKFNSDTPDPIWTTLVGLVGTFQDNDAVSIQLSAESPINSLLTFTLVSGSLPSGLSLNALTGEISGTVNTGVIADQNFHFSVRVEDAEENVADRGFDILVEI